MAAAETTQIELGFTAPDFNLLNTITGENLSLDQLSIGNGLLVMFICNHCPYVIHIMEQLVSLANDYKSQGITTVAISSNDVENYPQDSPEKMKELASEYGFSFPYLYDETQEIAKLYDAVCTPDFSIFDDDLKCVYRGQLDGSRPGNDLSVTGSDIRKALDAIVNKTSVSTNQIPSIGCSIKWK
ncbi:MAG: thioredoxin family protein [Flavobacteriales bacterium]|nr:thioredoxin family protein [Flavobacteriales bacterium]